MNQEKIGKFIAQCRKEKNLTQLQLAEKLNMSDKSISKWETGKGMPDSSIMLELCKYLDVNVNELLNGEHIADEKYQEIANKNIVNIIKESEKNNKIKNILLISFVIILIIISVIILYKNLEIDIGYDSRLIKCEINNDKIICLFNGSSLIHLSYETIHIDNETLIFINGKMLLENKVHSHFETWDTMAQLSDGKDPRFCSGLQINKNTDLPDYKKTINVYYTNIPLKKIKKANKDKLKEIIEQSYLISEQ